MSNWEDTAIGNPVSYETFGCNVFKASPQTPDMIEPDVHIYREGAEKIDITAPDGRPIRMWTFRDTDPSLPRQRLTWPAPPMRVRQGQVVHTHLSTSTGPHTIHHHGIEPTTANDGVGHVSFEVGDSYIYQWKPDSVGSFFYHCHRNTALHFELGMYGPLIIDAPDLGDGKNYIYEGGPTYDSEMIWVADDIDPRWHEIQDHDAGLCGLDVGLNRFEPKYFLLSGIFNNETATNPKTMITAQEGERVLIRLLNASYSILEVKFTCDVEIVCQDGHAWGRVPWCPRTVTVPAGTPLELVTAQRYDLIVQPPKKGYYAAFMKFRHWITRRVQDNGNGRLTGRIKVV